MMDPFSNAHSADDARVVNTTEQKGISTKQETSASTLDNMEQTWNVSTVSQRKEPIGARTLNIADSAEMFHDQRSAVYTDTNPVKSPDTLQTNPVKPPDTQQANPAKSPDTQQINLVKSPDTQQINPVKPPDTQQANPVKSPDTQHTNPVKSPDTQQTNQVKSTDTQQTNPVKPLDTQKTNPVKSNLQFEVQDGNLVSILPSKQFAKQSGSQIERESSTSTQAVCSNDQTSIVRPTPTTTTTTVSPGHADFKTEIVSGSIAVVSQTETKTVVGNQDGISSVSIESLRQRQDLKITETETETFISCAKISEKTPDQGTPPEPNLSIQAQPNSSMPVAEIHTRDQNTTGSQLNNFQTIVNSTYGSSEETPATTYGSSEENCTTTEENPISEYAEKKNPILNESMVKKPSTFMGETSKENPKAAYRKINYTPIAVENIADKTAVLIAKPPEKIPNSVERATEKSVERGREEIDQQIVVKHQSRVQLQPEKNPYQIQQSPEKNPYQIEQLPEKNPILVSSQSDVKQKQTNFQPSSSSLSPIGYPILAGFESGRNPKPVPMVSMETSDAIEQVQSSSMVPIRVSPKKAASKPIGFQFEIAGDDKESFKCPLCEAIVRSATELPCCAQLLCRDCSTYYENEEMKKHLMKQGNADYMFVCIVCQEMYNSKEKTWVKSTDKIIQRLQVKCLQKRCQWVGSIQSYQEHETKCDYLEVHCQHFDLGCSQTIERRDLEKHNAENKTHHHHLLLDVVKTTSVLVSVLHKKREETKQSMDGRGREIESLQRENVTSERKFEKIDEAIENLDKHFESKLKTLERSYEAKFVTLEKAFETKFANFQKEYEVRIEHLEKDFGTKLKNQESGYEAKLLFEQKVFGTRLENVTKNCQQKIDAMTKDRDLTTAITKKCHELDNERVKLEKKVTELSNLLTDQSELLKIQNDVIQSQCQKVDSLDAEWKDFKTKPTTEELYGEIEAVKHQGIMAEVKNVDKKVETTRKDLAREILNLKIFAERISKLHLTLSEPSIRGYEMGDKTLGQIQYEQKDEVVRWNKFADEIYSSKDEGCVYLKDLKEAIKEYRKSVYSAAWSQRLLKMSYYGMECGQVLKRYVKIVSSLVVVKLISAKVYQTVEEYEKTVRKEKWCKHSHHVASYFDRYGSCLFVAILYPMEYRNVYILHAQDEEKKLVVPANEHVRLDDLQYSINGYVVLHLKK